MAAYWPGPKLTQAVANMAQGTIYFSAPFPVQFVSKPKEKSKPAYSNVTYE
jgi:hypothetical protein